MNSSTIESFLLGLDSTQQFYRADCLEIREANCLVFTGPEARNRDAVLHSYDFKDISSTRVSFTRVTKEQAASIINNFCAHQRISGLQRRVQTGTFNVQFLEKSVKGYVQAISLSPVKSMFENTPISYWEYKVCEEASQASILEVLRATQGHVVFYFDESSSYRHSEEFLNKMDVYEVNSVWKYRKGYWKRRSKQLRRVKSVQKRSKWLTASGRASSYCYQDTKDLLRAYFSKETGVIISSSASSYYLTDYSSRLKESFIKSCCKLSRSRKEIEFKSNVTLASWMDIINLARLLEKLKVSSYKSQKFWINFVKALRVSSDKKGDCLAYLKLKQTICPLTKRTGGRK